MPYKNKDDRVYSNTYQSSPEQKKRRAMRNAARAKLMKEGKVRKGDGRDVDHVKMLSKGGKNIESNLRVTSEHDNRSFPRNSNHSAKNNGDPKKKKR